MIFLFQQWRPYLFPAIQNSHRQLPKFRFRKFCLERLQESLKWFLLTSRLAIWTRKIALMFATFWENLQMISGLVLKENNSLIFFPFWFFCLISSATSLSDKLFSSLSSCYDYFDISNGTFCFNVFCHIWKNFGKRNQ